jgi:mannose-6-phosphate isomerase-like protein (cupin superfamily)
MNKLLSMASFALMVAPIVAQAPNNGIAVWKSADLKAYTTTLPARMNAQKLGSQNLAPVDGNTTVMVHREASLEAEVHDNAADFDVVQSGGCTLIVGGTLKDGHSVGTGEWKGASIDGGQSFELAPGDIVNIPAKTPHQMVIPAGGQITYFLMKIPAK